MLHTSVKLQTAFYNLYMLSLILFVINTVSLGRNNCVDVVSVLDSVVFGTL